MHQVTVIEPKWLSEVAPTFFRVADQNKISKRKASEKIEPLFDRFAADKDDWVSRACPGRPVLTNLSVSASRNEQHDHHRHLDNESISPLSVVYIAHRTISRYFPCKARRRCSMLVRCIITSRSATRFNIQGVLRMADDCPMNLDLVSGLICP